MRRRDILITIFFTLTILSSGQTGRSDWPLFRGTPDLAGLTDNAIPPKPKLLWSLRTEGRTVSSPVVRNGVIYFGNNDGTVFAVSAQGKILWKYETETSLEAPPLVVDNKVIIASLDGEVRALDCVTGESIWLYKAENQVIGSPNILVRGNRKLIVFGSYDFYLHCLDPANGKPEWKFETENFINGTPAIFNGRLVFGGCDGFLRVVESGSGKEEKRADMGVYIASSPALSPGYAYFGSYEGIFYAVDLGTMTIKWQVEPRDEYSVIMATPAIAGNRVIVGSEDKYLYCYNADDGSKEWEFRTNAKIDGSAVVSGEDVLFGSRDGNIYIVNLQTGQKRWSFDAGNPVSSSPALIDGRFFILTEDGRLMAFGE